MSGDRPVVLVAEAGSIVHRGVTKLGTLVTLLPPFAVIGGLAVILRLGQAHRATNDIDAVSDNQAAVLEMLVAEGYTRRGDSVVLEPDLKLDLIDVSEGDPEYLPFLTHRYAFDTRTTVGVEVVDAHGRRLATVEPPVALTSAVVAMKLGVHEDTGRRRNTPKVGSDAFDVVRLLQRRGPEAVADELLQSGLPELIEGVERVASRHLVDEVDRTASAIVRSTVHDLGAITPAQIELLGRAFVGKLRCR